jgi:hypothetical protein
MTLETVMKAIIPLIEGDYFWPVCIVVVGGGMIIAIIKGLIRLDAS